MRAITSRSTRQDNALQSFGETVPFRDDIDKSLHIPLGDDMLASAPRRLTVEHVSLATGWPVTILALDTSVFDFDRRASVEHEVEGARPASFPSDASHSLLSSPV